MAHGQNAERNGVGEYCSRRCYMPLCGWYGKFLTHRRERAKAKRIELMRDTEKWDET